ncbi:hypothetical protein CBR_g52114 [Chara braunii]|uniref:Reverse transcriptase domain-containing protein n=1 Tax=Chara braunii TaxID=69332 RepID=A0A388M9T7_CHABU|nr:hypothetical protein CBR_g52114 [Chara braunii]|eukprot:GBG91232.1 hypothetical protein CBR_g52114 [Chara braunii]
MTSEFRAMLDRFMLVYLDDILVYSRTLEDHLEDLRPVLETLRRAKYKANGDKCEFARQELEYLVHFVTPEGISPLPDKIQVIQEWPKLRNVTNVRSFLGRAGYYQRFIKGYSKIAAHLTKLQREDRPIDFGEDARESFLALKAALLSAEVLRIYDPLLPTRVTTNASSYGIGAVLEQLLAFVHVLKRWRHFLLGRSQFDGATSAVPRQQRCHVSNSATSAVPRQQQCHVNSATVPRQQCPATMTGSVLGMPGQLANESIAEYRQHFETQLALIAAEEQRQLAAEAVRLQAEAAATAVKQRLQAEADADTQARRKEAQALLQRHEATSIEKLKFWHFEPAEEHDDATSEEQHKEFMAKLVTRLVYTCNHLQSELANLQQDVRSHKAQHDDAARALDSRVQDLEQTAPRPEAGESSSAPSARQLEERVDHVVAMLGDISTFAAPATISNQLDTLKTEVQELHQLPNKDSNAVQHYKMPTFQIEKFYTHQDSVLRWEGFTTQLRILFVAKHAYIGALFLNSKGRCQIWLSHLATVHDVDVADLKDKISWEELTRLWKKRFIVDDAPALAINRLFAMTQGNTSTLPTPLMDAGVEVVDLHAYIAKIYREFKTQRRSLDEHVEHLRTVLERLRQAKYKANRDKCEFARQEMQYLGHYVTLQGIRPLADKIEALRVWPEPINTTDVRSFMGLAGYYQRFITGYSRIVAPMTRLQSPKVPFVFDDDARRSFQALKTAMLMAPVLSIYDPTLPTRVTTDASGYGTGAVLEQHDGDDWHPVEYFSHKVPPINSLDDARKKELLAFVMALKRWWHFLLGRRRFTWVTDNNPLTYYKTQDTVSNTIGR